MDPNYNKENIGRLKISEDVISSIARYAAKEIDGVTDIGYRSAPIKGIFKSALQNPIKIILADDVATININIVVRFGGQLSEIGKEVQKNVKNSVQNMTGITVSKVNVIISGVSFEEMNEAE